MQDAQILQRGEVNVRGLTKSFPMNGARLDVLTGVSLRLAAGDALAIVGPAGSGKSTLLRVIAGLEQADAGEVLIDGHRVISTDSDRAMVFAEPHLQPWASVLRNVAAALEGQGVSATRAQGRARHSLRLVGLGDYEHAFPRHLSGSMALRASIARAMTVQPDILLMDEPFAALEAEARLTMQTELARIRAQTRVTTILVTRDLDEAISLADRVLVLPRPGTGKVRLIEIDLPRPRDRTAPECAALRHHLAAGYVVH